MKFILRTIFAASLSYLVKDVLRRERKKTRQAERQNVSRMRI